ncbi:hypothetical protein KKJ04_25540, partial [Xenorhabdus bovienii]|uniref:hypothetical protein n=1 Tax=Xenorhabdus bovienii TaxID=40576 RepID=UPI0023B2AF7D
LIEGTTNQFWNWRHTQRFAGAFHELQNLTGVNSDYKGIYLDPHVEMAIIPQIRVRKYNKILTTDSTGSEKRKQYVVMFQNCFK